MCALSKKDPTSKSPLGSLVTWVPSMTMPVLRPVHIMPLSRASCPRLVCARRHTRHAKSMRQSHSPRGQRAGGRGEGEASEHWRKEPWISFRSLHGARQDERGMIGTSVENRINVYRTENGVCIRVLILRFGGRGIGLVGRTQAQSRTGSESWAKITKREETAEVDLREVYISHPVNQGVQNHESDLDILRSRHRTAPDSCRLLSSTLGKRIL